MFVCDACMFLTLIFLGQRERKQMELSGVGIIWEKMGAEK